MFDLYPRNSHRTPQQIAEDAGGSFEPMKAARSKVVTGVDEETTSKSALEVRDAVTEISKRSR